MRGIIGKELRQAHVLLLFGPVFIALVGVLYLYLTRAYVRTFADQENVDTACAVLLAAGGAVSPLLALTAAFAAEQERGTLALLLALPVSRLRMWSAKLLASMVIALACVVCILLPGWLVIPGAVDLLYLPARAWDLAIWWCFAVAVATFCSTYCERTLTALINTILVGGALFVGVALLQSLGASLLGYDEVLDMELWLLAGVPALLLGSLVTFSRGGLLQSRRKLGLAFGVFLCCLLITWSLVVGVTRRAVRYQREAVKRIEVVGMDDGARAVAIHAMGSPITHERTLAGWRAARDTGRFRSNHTVVLDLRSGRELSVHPAASEAAISGDGAYAAALGTRRALVTYAAEERWYWHAGGDPRDLEIWDLRRDGPMARPLADLPWRPDWAWPGLEWSADGSWLTMGGLWKEGAPDRAHTLLLMRPDGSHRREIALLSARLSGYLQCRPWAWDPAGKAIYVLDPEGKLRRYPVDGGAPRLVWDFSKGPDLIQRSPSASAAREVALSVSPDGKLIVAAVVVAEQASQLPYAVQLYVVAADGSRTQLIHQDSHRSGWSLDELRLTWSHDGEALYFVPPWYAARGLPPSIYRWRAGEPSAVSIPLPVAPSPLRLAALPAGDVLLWSFVGGGFLLEASDHLRPLPHGPESKTYTLVGLDAEGRAILQRASGEPELAALDLATGKLTRIYP